MKIIITELNWPSGIEILQQRGWEVIYDPNLWNQRDQLRSLMSDADGIIVRNQTKVDAELLDWSGKLKVIGRLGVGLDNIDLASTAEHGAVVVYGKNANATSVAEYVIASLFACSRKLTDAARDVTAGNWNRKKHTGFEIFGKTLGLIGLGEISHRTATRAKALGLNVVGFDPFLSPYDFPIMETGVKSVKLEEVLEQSDFVSIHVPLTPETRNMLDRTALDRMKPSAFLINSSRGGIVNEDDLYHALSNGKLAGAVLDVLQQEPPDKQHPLLQLDNCLITPHIAGLTEESQSRTSELVSGEVIRELEGEASLCRVTFKR